MSLKDVLSRIEGRLLDLGLSAHAASLLAKKPDAIRNLRRAVQNDDRRGITTETLVALAPALQTTAAWLFEILPEYEQLPPEGLDEIELPLPVPPNTIAFEVEGNSMWPRYNAGDVVICSEEEHDPAAISGREAAVRTADGKRFLKTIRRGTSADTFDLESHNAPPIRDVAIVWASPILMIMPSTKVHSPRNVFR